MNACIERHTDVSKRPGSPNDERQEMASLPNGITLPGVGNARKVGVEIGIMV